MEQVKYSYVPIIELDKIRQGMAEVEKLLNNKNLTEKQRQNFQNLFSTLTREFSNYSTLLQRGFKKDIDVSNIDKVGVKIEKIINNILNDYQGIDFNVLADGFQASTNRAKELREALIDIKRQMKDIGGQDLKVKGNAALTKMSTVSSSSNIEKFRKGLNEGDVTSMNEAYNALKANEKRFSTEKGAAYSTELAKLKSILDQIAKNPAMKQLSQDLNNVEAELQDINKTELNKLIQKFNQGKINTKQFLDSMRKLGVTTRQVGQEQVEYNKTLESFKDKIKYFVSLDTVLGLVKRTIREAYESVKELDAVMTQTAVVSEYTIGEMWETLPEKTAQANKYGVSIKGVYEVETLYYQQGLKANEVTAVGAETLKMAKISGLDYAAATDAMTAALRGFNMEVNAMNAQKVNDVYSALAAYTASDVEELSTAMTKTASISASAGMEFANTSAFLAKIIETTRESAETAGTAMKTIVARFTEIKNNPNTFADENGEVVDVNKIDTALASVGVSLKDTEGQIRNLDDVFLDLAKIWDTLDKNTQRYIATIAAGSRQQSRFIAMMSDYERTMELVDIANNSAGASQEQFDKTLESLEFKVTQLKNAWNQFIQSLANNTVIKMAVDILTGILNVVNSLINGFGLLKGGVGSFAIALTILYNTFKLLKKVTTANASSPLIKILTGNTKGTTEVKAEIEKGVNSAYTAIKNVFQKASYQGTKKGVQSAKVYKGGKLKGTYKIGNGNTDTTTSTGFSNTPLGKDFSTIKSLGGKGTLKSIGKSLDSSGMQSLGNFAKGGGLSSTLAGTAIGVELATSLVSKIFDPNNDKNRNKEDRTAEVVSLTKQRSEAIDNELKQITQVSDSYKDQIATMKVANKGTKEYIQAQKEANKIIRDIVKNNPELRKSENLQYVNGNWIANDAFWKEYEEGLIQKEREVDRAQITANYANEIAQYEDRRDNAGVKINTISDEEAKNIQSGATTAATVGGISGVAAGMLVGAAVGSVVPVIGNIVGAVVGGIVGFIGGMATGSFVGGVMTAAAKAGYDSKKVDKYTKKISQVRDELSNEDIEKLAAGETEGYEDIVLAFNNNTSEIREFFKVYKENSTELNALLSNQSKRTASNLELTNSLIDTSKYAKDYGDFLKQEFSTEQNIKIETLGLGEKTFTGTFADEVGKEFEENIQKYKDLEDKDKTKYEIEAMSQLGFKKVGDKYYNKEGQEVSKDVAQETAAQLYATELTQDRVNDIAEWLIEREEDLIKKDNNIASAFFNKGGSLAGAKGINTLLDNKLLEEEAIQEIWNVLGDNASLAFTLANSNTEAGVNQFIAMLVKSGIKLEDLNTDAETLKQGFLRLDSVSENLSSKLANVAAVLNIQGKVKKGEGLTAEEYSAIADVDSYSAAFYQKVGDLYYYIGTSLGELSQDQILNAYKTVSAYAEDVLNNEEGAVLDTLTEMALSAGTPDIFLDKELYKNEQEAINFLTAMARSLGATDIDILGLKNEKDVISREDLKNLINKLKLNKINEYNNEVIKTLKEKIYNAIIYERQKEIDQLTEENKNIEESNQKVLEEIRNSVDKIRQDRENEKKEQEITDKQLELAYLKADTNASAADIIKLEEEIANSQESYVDDLIDQQLDIIEKTNQKAADQRKAIIQKLTDSLTEYKKSEKIWKDVQDKIDSFVKDGAVNANINIKDFLKEAVGYDAMSPEEKQEWENKLKESVSALFSKSEPKDIESPKIEKNDNSSNDNSKSNDHVTEEDSIYGPDTYYAKDPWPEEGNPFIIEGNEYNKMKEKAIEKDGIKYYPIIDKYLYGKQIYIPANDYYIEDSGKSFSIWHSDASFYKFKKGGLNTQTGPAWLDGTPSNPEMVLNARDTKNFIQLKDILGSIMTNSSPASQMSGDNYFDININVESISSDYDVERLSEKIKNEINNDARYRNVNSINLVR